MSFPIAPIDGQFFTTADGRTYKFVSAGTLWDFQGFTSSSPKANLAATLPPSATDDVNSGYSIGSMWVDTIANKAYTNVDATATAAIWMLNGGGGVVVGNTFPLTPSIGDLFHNTTTDKLYVWDGNAWIDVVAGGASSIKSNFVATTSPVNTDSSSLGYAVGSVWINTALNLTFICVDATPLSAIWKLTSSDTLVWKIISTSTLAIPNDGLFIDTTFAPVTVTLPTTASIGQKIGIVDVSGTFATNNLTLNGNGSNIMGLGTNMVVNTNNTSFTLISTGINDWRVFN